MTFNHSFLAQGLNVDGQLGDKTNVSKTIPTRMFTTTTNTGGQPVAVNAVAIACGVQVTLKKKYTKIYNIEEYFVLILIFF